MSRSHSTSAHHTSPMPLGSRSAAPVPISGRNFDSPLRSADAAEHPAAAREDDAGVLAAFLIGPALHLRAPAARRVLEVADDRERQRGEAHRDPIEEPKEAPRRRAERRTCAPRSASCRNPHASTASRRAKEARRVNDGDVIEVAEEKFQFAVD